MRLYGELNQKLLGLTLKFGDVTNNNNFTAMQLPLINRYNMNKIRLVVNNEAKEKEKFLLKKNYKVS